MSGPDDGPIGAGPSEAPADRPPPKEGEEARLVTGSVRRHLFTQTMPMLVGIGATMSVGIVDAYFVGQLGPDELAVIGFIFPIQVALQSLGVGVMVGVNSVVARALGGRNQLLAEQRGLQGAVVSLMIGLGISAGLVLLRHPIFLALNVAERLLPLIDAYIIPYAIGFPALVLTMGMNGTLRGQGEAMRSSTILLSVAVVNLGLDPLLIAGWGPIPSFGIAGAAYATAGAFVMAALIGFVLLQTSSVPLRMRRAGDANWPEGLRELARVGGPAAFSNAINPAGLTLLTGLLARHGEQVVAAFGAAARVHSMAVVPLLALSSSIGPIVGQNWGARRYDRARAAYRESIAFCVLFGGAMAALLVGFRGSLGSVFSDTPEVQQAFANYFLVTAWSVFGFGILIVTNGALNAVDHAGAALRLSVVRVALVMVPLGWLGGEIGGAVGVYVGVLVANLFGAGAGLWMGRRALRP